MLARVLLVSLALSAGMAASAQAPPRLPSGKPDLQGIWRVQNRAADDLDYHAARYDMPAGPSVVEGERDPVSAVGREQQRKNFAERATGRSARALLHARRAADHVPGVSVPDLPDGRSRRHHVRVVAGLSAHLYERSAAMHEGIESWMGDSRGHWEGDVLVVEVTDQNDRTWFDAAGDFHSDALKVTERYALRDANTIDYEVTIEDPKVFTRPWKIRMPLHRQTDLTRLLEYQCQAEKEEQDGAFERDTRTWYPAAPPADNAPFDARAGAKLPLPAATGKIRRLPDGKPDLSGWYEADAGGANYGLETHAQNFLTPASRGVVVDPKDGTLPYQRWARAESIDRKLPHRGYDDPTAHCFVAGVPRSHYVPAPFQILQPRGYVVMLFERMSWRHIALTPRPPLPDHVRLWQGDSVGHWDGDTLVVESRNFNGKAWLNEVGDVISHAETVVETFTPVGPDRVIYRATVSDPIAYTRPWTIEVPLNRQDDELLEVACHEDNGDLDHLHEIRDEYRATHKEK